MEGVAEALKPEDTAGQRLGRRRAHQQTNNLRHRDRGDGEVIGPQPQGGDAEQEAEQDGGQRSPTMNPSQSGPP